MATTNLPAYPSRARFDYTTTLGETAYRLTFTWRTRQEAWYLDLALEDGTELVNGRKLSAESLPLAGIDLGENAPAGTLYVRGPVNYGRADLGTNLVLVWVPAADLAAAFSSSSGPSNVLGVKYTAN